MTDHAGATERPWEFRDGFILANGEALKLVGVQIPMVSLANRVEAIRNAKLLVTAVNSFSAAEQMAAALETIRHQWAGHSEQCAAVISRYKDKCDCDWPAIAKQCDATLSAWRKATGGVQ